VASTVNAFNVTVSSALAEAATGGRVEVVWERSTGARTQKAIRHFTDRVEILVAFMEEVFWGIRFGSPRPKVATQRELRAGLGNSLHHGVFNRHDDACSVFR
jgi:hypothetical protein